MSNICAVILAAGEGKRMKSDSPKVLSAVLFKPMLKWVIDAANDSGINNICVVTGYKHEIIDNYLLGIDIKCSTALQLERRGSAHAVMMAEKFLKQNSGGDVLILGGDAPFIDKDTIMDSYKLHKRENNSVTVVSANIDNPFGYGRIVRNKDTLKMEDIIEEKDANDNIRKICEVNSGAYWFNIDDLLSVIHHISNDNAQSEYYLPDAISLLLNKGLKVNAYVSKNPNTVLGANDCMQLYNLNCIARQEILNKILNQGINIPCTDGVIIGSDVTIDANTTILPGTIISGKSSIGNGCIIGPNTQVINSKIGNEVALNNVLCVDSVIVDKESIAPFTYVNKRN